jgi:hypothetical protein
LLAVGGAIFGALVAGPPSWLGGSGWAMDFGLDSVRFSFSLAFDFG